MSSRFPAAPAKAYGVGGEDHKTSASSEDPGTPRIISWEKSDTGGKELRKGTSGSQARPKSSHTDRSSMATIQDDDERMLAMIGYKQVSTDFASYLLITQRETSFLLDAIYRQANDLQSPMVHAGDETRV